MYFPGIPVVASPPSKAGGEGSIPALGTKILYATWHGKKQLKQRSEKPPAFSSPTFPGPPRVALVI